jgi:hypothetical protein
MHFLKGIHYRNRWLYNIQNRLKLGGDHDLRFRIAAKYLKPGDAVLDLCAGFGPFKDYLPPGCAYRCIEASPAFADILKQKNIPVLVQDIHQGLKPEDCRADAVVMIISLCHFRDTAAGELLETLKKSARRVIIVEDVLLKPRGRNSFINRMMNYMCQTDYYIPIDLFTAAEFQALMSRHGYACQRYDDRYWVGLYPARD